MSRWGEELGEFLVTAIAGSSALQAPLPRSCLDETSYATGVSSATVLLDLAKFYDIIGAQSSSAARWARSSQQ